VAIVGGGISGLYAGWRLMTSPKGGSPTLDHLAARHRDRRRIGLFEMSGRLGGRLHTVSLPGIPTVPAELGGMRYMSTQKLVGRLVEDDLRLPHVDAFVGPADLVYPRLEKGRGLPPTASRGEPLLDAIATVVGRDPTKLTSEEWLNLKRHGSWEGVPLVDWGIWNLLHHVIGPDDHAAVVDDPGHATVAVNWNAADAMPSFVAGLGVGVDFRRPAGGMQEITRGLARIFTDAGGTIACRRELTGFVADASGTVRLDLAIRPDRLGRPSRPHPRVYAKHLVLAVPAAALRRMAEGGGADLLEDADVQGLVAAVTPVPALDIACCYREPWWKRADDGPGRRRCATRVPIGYALHLGTEQEVSHGEAGNENCLVRVHSDVRTIGYWTGLVGDDAGARLRCRGDDWSEYEAPDRMVEEVHRLLRLAYGVDARSRHPERPYVAVVRDWSADPFGGGWNMWKIHEKSWLVADRMVQPMPGRPVYVCGESYSLQQGWVEGALDRAEHMVQRIFGLSPRPDRGAE
jgi:hypothetical protein